MAFQNLAEAFSPARVTPLSVPILSVVIPTFNERDNVARISAALEKALAGVEFEIVFVDDDSTDGTLDQIATLARRNPRIRVIHRIGRRGLSTAVSEGMLSTTSPYICVIDADLQHDERIIPQMLRLVMAGDADIAVGSRYTDGGGLGNWDRKRAAISGTATRLAKLIAKAPLKDPMSGFFLISRPAFYSAVRDLSGQGYKILLDICASANPTLRLREVPYEFRLRQAGESKLDALVAWEYLMLLADKMFGNVIPARFLSFTLIGGLGVFVHMAALASLMASGAASFLTAQAVATTVAMVFNFFLNNTLTYRDRRLKGVRALSLGLATFLAVCSLGAFANVGIANYLFSDAHYYWWSAGIAGILVGAVWNYAATSIFTWRLK
ncbi:MAG: glycosyltransferase family 2 protein [Mesorhizobium sp.]